MHYDRFRRIARRRDDTTLSGQAERPLNTAHGMRHEPRRRTSGRAYSTRAVIRPPCEAGSGETSQQQPPAQSAAKAQPQRCNPHKGQSRGRGHNTEHDDVSNLDFLWIEIADRRARPNPPSHGNVSRRKVRSKKPRGDVLNTALLLFGSFNTSAPGVLVVTIIEVVTTVSGRPSSSPSGIA